MTPSLFCIARTQSLCTPTAMSGQASQCRECSQEIVSKFEQRSCFWHAPHPGNTCPGSPTRAVPRPHGSSLCASNRHAPLRANAPNATRESSLGALPLQKWGLRRMHLVGALNYPQSLVSLPCLPSKARTLGALFLWRSARWLISQPLASMPLLAHLLLCSVLAP